MPHPVDCSPFLAGSVALAGSLTLEVSVSCCSGTSPVIAGLSRTRPLETANRWTARPSAKNMLYWARHTVFRHLFHRAHGSLSQESIAVVVPRVGTYCLDVDVWCFQVLSYQCANPKRVDVAILLLEGFPRRCLRRHHLLLNYCVIRTSPRFSRVWAPGISPFPFSATRGIKYGQQKKYKTKNRDGNS